jgi:hypothetical protein
VSFLPLDLLFLVALFRLNDVNRNDLVVKLTLSLRGDRLLKIAISPLRNFSLRIKNKHGEMALFA